MARRSLKTAPAPIRVRVQYTTKYVLEVFRNVVKHELSRVENARVEFVSRMQDTRWIAALDGCDKVFEMAALARVYGPIKTYLDKPEEEVLALNWVKILDAYDRDARFAATSTTWSSSATASLLAQKYAVEMNRVTDPRAGSYGGTLHTMITRLINSIAGTNMVEEIEEAVAQRYAEAGEAVILGPVEAPAA